MGRHSRGIRRVPLPALLMAIALTGIAAPALAEPMDCLFFDGVEGGQAPTPQMEEVRWLHNCIRRTAEPRPTPGLRDLRWNATVAASAQSWANQCNFSHPGGHPYGENLAMGTANFYDLAALTMLWIDEYTDYNYAANSCAPNAVCGHYTQMVWRSTQRLGCGEQICGSNRYLVCRYDPPGNWVGQRPY
jgi:pathogenesis-related protein 1